jgi:uncharacterized protein (TIGR02444 family)
LIGSARAIAGRAVEESALSDQPATSPAARPASPFWAFSLRIYGMAGVPAACLALQEGAGVDVNVLLFLLFAAHCGRLAGPAQAEAAREAIDAWRLSTVVPLRAVRQFLRAPPSVIDAAMAAALRQRVKAVELEAERLQQEALYACFPVTRFGDSHASRMDAAHANVAALETALGTTFDPGAVATLMAAFAELQDKTS